MFHDNPDSSRIFLKLLLIVLGLTLSRILNGKAGISADMALRLENVPGTRAEMWISMQAQYDLWITLQHSRPLIKNSSAPV